MLGRPPAKPICAVPCTPAHARAQAHSGSRGSDMGEPAQTTIPLDALVQQAQGLLNARHAADAAPLLTAALAKVAQLDATALSAEFAIVHLLAHLLLSEDDLDSTRTLTDRLATVAGTTQPDRVYAVRRLQALMARD